MTFRISAICLAVLLSAGTVNGHGHDSSVAVARAVVHDRHRDRVNYRLGDPMTLVLASTGLAFTALNDSYTAQLLAGIAFREWLGNLPAVPSAASVQSAPGRVLSVGGGSITADQFAALNQCEASGQNGWRTGRYGLETGTGDVGSWSDAQQQAEVQRIYNTSGAGAWGVACRGILGG